VTPNWRRGSRRSNNVTAVRATFPHFGDLDRPFAQVKREKRRLDVIFANAGRVQLDPSLAMVTAPLDSWAASMPEHRMAAWIVEGVTFVPVLGD
jgi:hypothetical protein